MYKRYQILEPDAALEYAKTLRALNWKTRGERGSTDHNVSMKVLTALDDEVAARVTKELIGRIARHPDFEVDCYPVNFQRPWFHLTTAGGDLARHADSLTDPQSRTDLSMSLFLADPDSYEGGELVLESPVGEPVSVKGDLGELIVYPTGWPHWVTTVTSGERLVMALWAQSQCRDHLDRERLASFRIMLRTLTAEIKVRGDTDPELARTLEHWSVDLHCLQTYLRQKWLDTPSAASQP